MIDHTEAEHMYMVIKNAVLSAEQQKIPDIKELVSAESTARQVMDAIEPSVPTIETVATECLAFFETKQRNDNTSFVSTHGNAPDWVKEVVYAAHMEGEMFPDDWRYEAIESAVRSLSEDADMDVDDWAQTVVDVMNSELLKWVASNSRRVGFVDEAKEEISNEADFFYSISLGQFLEYRDVMDSVRNALQERLDTLEEEI